MILTVAFSYFYFINIKNSILERWCQGSFEFYCFVGFKHDHHNGKIVSHKALFD